MHVSATQIFISASDASPRRNVFMRVYIDGTLARRADRESDCGSDDLPAGGFLSRTASMSAHPMDPLLPRLLQGGGERWVTFIAAGVLRDLKLAGRTGASAMPRRASKQTRRGARIAARSVRWWRARWYQSMRSIARQISRD